MIMAVRNYKDEYRKFQSSRNRKRYRAELNKFNREHNDPKGNSMDASHKGGKIVGYESEHVNRGRAGEGGRRKGRRHRS